MDSLDVEGVRKELTHKIRIAFPCAPIPNAADIVPKTSYLNLEQENVRAFLSGRRWDSLSIDCLIRDYLGDESAILAFLSLQGFRYYYPAFLLITLQHFSSSGRVVVYSSFYQYLPSDLDDQTLDRVRKARIRVFSQEQLGLIVETLRFVAQVDADEYEAGQIESAIIEIQRA